MYIFVLCFDIFYIKLQELLHVVAPLINEQKNVDVSISKRLMFTIWVLAKPESFLSVGDRFGLSKNTGHQIFKNVVNILTQLMPQYVTWPNEAQRQISCNVCFL